MLDLHIHTQYSADSDETMERYCQKALKEGVSFLCFTDHVDYNRNDYGYGYYKVNEYFEALDKVRRNYGDQLNILAGIELSEPHLYQAQMEELSKYPYDLIIGSIHWVGDMFPCKEVREKYSAKEFYQLYYKEVFDLVSYGKFDCLGHIDFPKRYYGSVEYNQEILKSIFDTMITKEIVPEINTSSLRKGIHESMPDREMLHIYKECGGQYVTVGSDAHEVKDLHADYPYAEQLVKDMGLEMVGFKNRQLVKL